MRGNQFVAQGHITVAFSGMGRSCPFLSRVGLTGGSLLDTEQGRQES
jgi:hypothetical protein